MKSSTRVLSLVIAMLMLFSVFSVAYSAKEVEVSETGVTMTGGEVLYLKPNSNWTKDGARFAAYFFGSGNTWASLEQCPRDAGYYKVTVPSGSWSNVIFCRMNPSATANNWNNKWNQSGDLVYDGTKNLFTVASGSWDGAKTAWSVWSETPAPTEPPASEDPSSDTPSSEEPSSEEPSSEEPSEDPKPVKVNNVEADPTSTTVKFTWDLLDGATKYWVYQYNEANDTWSSVVSSYTDTAILKKLKGDTTYKFKVTARIGDNVYLNINDADLIEVTTDKAVATSSITAITGVTSADITWEPVEGATKYWVYKSTSESGPFYIYTSSLETTCTAKRLRPDTTYYFKIQALTFENGIDCYSDINDSPLLTVHTGSASIITTAAVENTATTATITWPAFENADKYWVLYSTTSADTNDRSHWTTLTSTTDTTYTFKNLQPNTVYYLNVCARYTDGGVVSTIDYIPVMVRTAYSNDDFITFTPVDDTHVTLTWDEGIEDVSKVWICAIDADGKEIGINSTTSNSITIRFADYKNYSYALKVVDSAGRIGYLTKTGGELYHE